MDRLACVNVIALPLQILSHQHPNWVKEGPIAVVDRDEPNGTIEWVDKEARHARIRPGMRYGEALSIRDDLRAGTVADEEIAEAIDALLTHLRDFSPFVEPSESEPGIFWLDVAGLEGVFESLEAWTEALSEALLDRDQFYTSVAVGFTRFGTYAVARSIRQSVVFSEAASEREAARQVPLASIGLSPALCTDLEKLGIETLGAFIRLPPTGVRRRFGQKAHRIHQMARGDLELPLQADLSDGPIQKHVRLDETIAVSTRLVFVLKRELNPLLARLAEGQHRITAIEIELHDGSDDHDSILVRPATPTVDTSRLLELIRLRLENRSLEYGIDEVTITVRTRRNESDQLQLFAEKPPRDPADANRALERLRAEFGRDAVLRAVPRDGHLPEARFEWKPFERMEESNPETPIEYPALVRRLWNTPQPLRSGDQASRQLALPSGDGVFLGGPYLVSGGWWVREVRRAYYFAERPNGELLWIYWDDRRERWFLHGRLE